MKLIICVLAIWTTGCHWPGPGGTAKGNYEWGFYNASGIDLEGVRATAKSGTFEDEIGAGDLDIHITATTSPGLLPIPVTATVYWVTPDRVQHAQTLDVRRSVPNPDNFDDGQIWFKFTGETWELVVYTKEQADAHVKRRLGEKLPSGSNAAAPDD